jgi:hypothetical protein
MENKGLIFIPDISGFTRFVKDVEIDHSRHIIQELLETIINANQLDLEISEVEGDAILFYKYGETPDLKDIYSQVEKMFCAFHKHLISYDHHRLCQCKACTSAIDLTLKVITHYGEFTGYNVKNFSKLIGKDIIVAHQLLKNDIEDHEYWLVTEDLARDDMSSNLPKKLDWNKSIKETESGNIPFQYTQLGHLKNSIIPDPPLRLEIENKIKVLSFYKEFDTDIITLLHGVADFHTRKRWQINVKDIDNISHSTIPRVGTSHRCLFEKGHMIMLTSSYNYSPEKIEYSETDEEKKSAIYSTFTKIAEKKTGLTVDFYLRNNPITLIMFNLFMKKKMEKMFTQSLGNLVGFVKEINFAYPTDEHS